MSTSATPEIAVLCGAISPEREVSLRSGAAVAAALERVFPRRVTLFTLEKNALPAVLDPRRHAVLPVIHGDYGEDGALQRELDAAGFAYAGCDAASCAVCIDKDAAKRRFAAAGALVPRSARFTAGAAPDAAALVAELGSDDLVLKPADKGSSVGLHFAAGAAQIAAALEAITGSASDAAGAWLAEPRVTGREMTIGILDGRALGIVEIRPKSGRYDYATKYGVNASEYIFPAPLDPDPAVDAALRRRVERDAERAFAACGCRDFARADFILTTGGGTGSGSGAEATAGTVPVFLEINTHPGMTDTSLLPKSASCAGLGFDALCARMVAPALARFTAGGG
ncbi:MAG: D-alanine--D-alanine ligase [Puniceicoccales bacterium]|jgi:D-alanine-D-alanine ligase|nr:D-alanine--D-alanine ligase [Puniceicoccales bacterium]